MLTDVKVTHPDFYREIRFPGYEDRNAIWDMHVDGPYVYIPLCTEFPVSKSAALFRYDTRDESMEMIGDPDGLARVDLSTGVMPASKFHTAIRTMKDGRLFMVTHNTAAGLFHPTWAMDSLWHDPTGFCSRAYVYDQKSNAMTYVGIPVPNEDFYFGQIDAEWNKYYAYGYRTGTLYVIDLDTFQATEIAHHPVKIAIVVDDDHMVYTNDWDLRVWKWDPIKQESTMTSLQMPCSPYMKEPKGQTVYMWKDPDGWIYAVCMYANRICRFKPRENIMEDLGNGWQDNPEFPGTDIIFSPVRVPDGRIYYGVLNEAKGRGNRLDGTEIIEFDPETKSKRNLGTMVSSDGTNACTLGEGVLGADGKIYWGDGNHGKRPALVWVFDPSKVPSDFIPKDSVQRIEREEPPPEVLNIEIPAQYDNLYRFHPLLTQVRHAEFQTEQECDPSLLQSIPLIGQGFVIYDNAVAGLSCGGDGAIYGLAGKKSYKLIRVDQKNKIEIIADIPASQEILNGSVVITHEDAVFCVGDAVFCWTLSCGLEKFAELDDGQRPVGLALDKSNSRLYVLAEPSNILHVLDAESGKEINRIELGGYTCSRWITAASQGCVYGFEINAGIYKIDIDQKKLTLSDKIPVLRGTEFIAECTSLSSPVNGVIWGGTRQGYLFSIDSSNDNVTNHGKPGNWYLKGVTVMGEQVVCFSGSDFGDTHLYRYHPLDGFNDLGMVTHKLINDAVVGKDGTLYAGEFSSASEILILESIGS